MKLDAEILIEIEEDVYSPSDDSLLMLKAVNPRAGQTVLEMGTGSGIIALHCAKQGCKVTAADISETSLNCARKNAQLNNLNVIFVQSDLFSNISEKYDIIIFNPPYLSSQDAEVLAVDDKRQLVGGEEGHELSVRFLEQAVQHLAEGGRIFLLTSTETVDKVIANARELFLIEEIAQQRMFFEVLAVWELRFNKN